MSLVDDLSTKLTEDILKASDRVTGLVDGPDDKREILFIVSATLVVALAEWEQKGLTKPPRERDASIRPSAPNEFVSAILGDLYLVARRIRERRS